MTAQTILPANSASGGFEVANSLRFNRGSSDYLNRTLGTPTNVDKATFSTWVKFSDVTSSNDTAIFAATADGNNTTHLEKLGSQVFRLNMRESSSYIGVLTTNRVFRDPSAWMHIVVAFDTTQGTASNRIKLYINGVQETSFSTATYPDQNVDLRINTSGQVFNIGNRGDTGNHPDAYYAETVFIDGQQLAADQFGEFDEDSGIWKPINVSGLTFGDNGFYLQYKETGTSANASGIGADTSGNTNHLTVNNLTAVDQSTDTCTNNFATMNPLNNLGSNIAYSEGNLIITPGTSDYKTCISTIAVDSGKWYAEFKAVSGHNGSTDVSVGIVGADDHIKSTGSKAMSAYLSSFGYGSGGLVKKYNNVTIRTDATYTDDDIIGIAVDMDNLKLYWSKNGTFQNSGDPTSGATGTGAVAITPAQLYYIAVATISSGGVKVFAANFGSPPYSESGGNSDADGHGNFLTAPPSGYFALCTKNLAEYGG